MPLFKQLKQCTFDDHINFKGTHCKLCAMSPAENVKHVGQVCVVNVTSKVRKWVDWNVCVEIVA